MSIVVAGRNVGPIGVGLMGMTRPGTVGKAHPPMEEAVETLKNAIDSGANFLDGGLFYGTAEYNSLHLLHAYFSKYPTDESRVVISIKACFDIASGRPLNDANGVKAEIERCLRILDGKCRIDIFQPGRIDPDTPIEVTIGAIAEYVRAGKIGGIGLSECSANSISRAVAVHPIAAVEVEVSLFATQIFNNGIAAACKEHGIPIVAYSPLGKGFLTGELKKHEDLPANDYRKFFPRFAPENFDQNIKLANEVEKIAKRKGVSVAQVAIAWVSAKSMADVPIIPIPGVTSKARVDENCRAIALTPEEIKELDRLVETIEVTGHRHPQRHQKYTEA